MKIGIITYYKCTNYGALFQGYALQRYLRCLGHDAVIIDHKVNEIEQGFKYEPRLWKRIGQLKFKDKIGTLIRYLLRYKVYKLNRLKFRTFWESKMCIVPESHGKEKFDVLVYGSDQIWNPSINGTDYYFLGESLMNADRRIAYAASCGAISKIDGWDRDKLDKFLCGYKKIAVREQGLKTYLEDNFNLKSDIVCDPVFLITQAQWREVSKKPNTTRYHKLIKGRYVLVYDLSGEQCIKDCVREIEREGKYEIVQINQMVFANDGLNHNILAPCSPEEFLWLVDNAAGLLTSSFHGVVFSIIFNTPVLAFHSADKDRLPWVLKMAGIGNRFTSEMTLAKLSRGYEQEPYSIISPLIKQSKQWLEISIS